MNIDSILKDAKSMIERKSGKSEVTDMDAGSRKRKREGDDAHEKEKIMKMLEEADEIEDFDAARLRTLLSTFTKAIEKNVERRMKFPDEPNKFMDSEVKVNTLLQELHGLAANPELFPEFIRLKGIPPMIGLLSHENTDIAIEVVDLLKELTEPEIANESEGLYDLLVDELVKNDMIKSLVINLERLDEKEDEDKQAVHNTLGIFENLMEYAPEVAPTKLTADTKLLDWLLKRLRRGLFDENQLYASEILSMLLIRGGPPVIILGEKGGLKKLVRCVAGYRKKDPASLDEVELVENMFNCMCSTLDRNKKNQMAFAQADGLQLMVTMIRKKRYTQAAALKVLNYSITDSVANCEKLIDSSGLKAVFKAFMQRGKISKKHRKELEANEEHILHCIVQLFLHLSDVRYLRLLNKFQENGFEKIERLVELHEKYFRYLEDQELAWKRDHPGKVEDPDVRYHRRLEGGLYCLQLCALLLALISSAGEKTIIDRVIQLLSQQDSSLKDVQETLEEYHNSLADDKSGKKMKGILNNVLQILEGKDPEDNDEKVVVAPTIVKVEEKKIKTEKVKIEKTEEKVKTEKKEAEEDMGAL
mmetsp:Transcript_17465/g.26179  ORF Transcript_17465/g.26179 Transcript_17465/m.26179 type:complete len:589 (+) Transcript_17465:75-1841(+)